MAPMYFGENSRGYIPETLIICQSFDETTLVIGTSAGNLGSKYDYTRKRPIHIFRGRVPRDHTKDILLLGISIRVGKIDFVGQPLTISCAHKLLRLWVWVNIFGKTILWVPRAAENSFPCPKH